MPDDNDDTLPKRPVRSLEDIDESLNETDEELPQPSRIMKAKDLRPTPSKFEPDDLEDQPDEDKTFEKDVTQKELEDGEDQDEQTELAETEASGVPDQVESDPEGEDPLDEGSDSPVYDKELAKQNHKELDEYPVDQDPDILDKDSDDTQDEESPLTEDLTPESQDTPKTNLSESTLDDLASENSSYDPEEQNGPRFNENVQASLKAHPPTGEFGQEEMEGAEMNIPRFRGGQQNSNNQPLYTSVPQRGNFSNYQRSGGGKRSNKWHLLILALIGLGVIAASVYLLKNQFGGFNFQASPSPSPEASVEPSPSPSPSPSPIARSIFKIRVLNGTTTSGLAGKTADTLKGLGYQIDKTGNAPKQDVAQTQVSVKSGDGALAEQLVKDLAGTFEASVAGNLASSDTADAEVIIGSK
jgi:hypothetical protein